MNSSLTSILAPRAIAIIGASNDVTKRGNLAIRYLQESRYRGAIYPVHPRETRILDLDCFPSVEQLPATPDLALICTPAPTVPDIIDHCGARGIKGVVVLATGFSETGEAGRALEERMVRSARKSGLRIIGPNTSGIFNAHCGMNLVGYRDLRPGSIGLLSQSGNTALSIVTEAAHNRQLGFSTYIGVGNEADLQFHEYLAYFGADPHTDVIVGYLEGLKNGRDFLATAAQVCAEKPLVLYKSGRTASGQQAARSHTGALTGSYAMAKDLMRQAGITLVERADEILPTAETLSLLAPLLPLKNNRVAILADGGGHGAIAADSLVGAGISLSALSPETQASLQRLLPPGAAVANPVDVAGGTDHDPRVFAQCAEWLLKDANVDALLIVGLFGGYALRFNEGLLARELECAEQLPQLSARTGKPLLLQSLYQPMATEPLVNLRRAGVPVLQSIDTATRCLASVVHTSDARRRLRQPPAAQPSAPYAEATGRLIANALKENRHCLYEYEALAALASYQAVTVTPIVIHGPEDLPPLARADHRQRWAMKIISKDILHKTDAGGVLLDIEHADLSTAYHTLLDTVKHRQPDADIHGVLLAPMAEPGTEVIIGMTDDRQYGPVILFGLGGIFVEVLNDVVFRSLPISHGDARAMLGEIAGSPLLYGARGRAPMDTDALARLLVTVSNLCLNHPEIAELDLNPVLVRESDYCILDARIILKAPREA